MLLYYVVLKPLRLLPVSEEVKKKYREAGLHCRFSYFSVTNDSCLGFDYCSNTYTILLNWKDWREYEHIHTLAWLGKDYAWVRILPPLWVLCLVPTILIAIDFIWTTWKAKVAACMEGWFISMETDSVLTIPIHCSYPLHCSAW